MAEDAGGDESSAPAPAPQEAVKKKKGLVSRLWSGIFGGGSEDYEKKLKHLSKEEASVLARMKRRARKSRKIARDVIGLAFVLEISAVGYASMMTKGMDLSWQTRAVRVLPMFVVPALAFAIYTGLTSLTRLFDQKDQKTLERLRAERKAKIDELKERTNYYMTQQLIQRYDLDPAAKAAAASVLASKLGADSGLKVFVGDENNPNAPLGRSNDVELVQSGGLRNRKSSHVRSHSTGSTGMVQYAEEALDEFGADSEEVAGQNQRMVEHYRGPPPNDGSLLSRLVAFLVGEDPAHSYALICGNCHMHNGLAKKEDFPYITYYCPHCQALNGPRQAEGHEPGTTSSAISPRSLDGCNVSVASSVAGTDVKTNLAIVEELPELPVEASPEKET